MFPKVTHISLRGTSRSNLPPLFAFPPCLEEVQQSTHQRKSFLTSLGAAFQPERPDRPSSNLSHRSHRHRGLLLFTPRFSQHLSEGRLQGRQLRHCRNVLRLVQNSSLCPPFREQSPWSLKCSLPCSRQLTLTDLPSAWLICFSLQPRNTNNQSTCSGIGKILVLLTGERKCSWYLPWLQRTFTLIALPSLLL